MNNTITLPSGERIEESWLLKFADGTATDADWYELFMRRQCDIRFVQNEYVHYLPAAPFP